MHPAFPSRLRDDSINGPCQGRRALSRAKRVGGDGFITSVVSVSGAVMSKRTYTSFRGMKCNGGSGSIRYKRGLVIPCESVEIEAEEKAWRICSGCRKEKASGRAMEGCCRACMYVQAYVYT